MRTAFNDVGFIEEDGKVIGLGLGYDWCAEHEWGIRGILAKFGVKTANQDYTPVGIEDRQTTEVPSKLYFITGWRSVKKPWGKPEQQPEQHAKYAEMAKKEPVAALVLSYRELEGSLVFKKTQLKPFAETLSAVGISDKFYTEAYNNSFDPARHNFSSAWDNSNFAFMVRGEDNIARLKQIYDAFLVKDIAFNTPGGDWTNRRGLACVQVSKMSEAYKASVQARDLQHVALLNKVQETGIVEYLQAKGLRYYALAPDMDSEGNLKFWLNPAEQKKHNHGWFTLQNLKDWGEGKGPVIKTEVTEKQEA